MILREILQEIPDAQVYGSDEVTVEGVCIDSRNCSRDDLFVCVQGFVQDGNRYAVSAAEQGAGSIMTGDIDALRQFAQEKGVTISEDGLALAERTVPVVVVEDLRNALASASACLWGNPTKKMTLIGITGTKGKTTTSYMVRSILTAAGLSSGMIGTICNYIGDERIETERTTPEANVIQPLFAKMVEQNISTCLIYREI